MKLAQEKERNHINVANEAALGRLFIAVLQIPGDLCSSLKQYTFSKLYFEKKKIVFPNVEHLITPLHYLPLNFSVCGLEGEITINIQRILCFS